MTADADLRLLTGPDARELLAAALATAGGELLDWSARQVDHRPGASTTVSYRARVRWSDREQSETLAASTGLRDVEKAPPGVLALSDGERNIAVWRFPLDPELPGLPAACDRARVGELLTSFGVPGIGPDGDGVRLNVRSYRPRRRAVIEATAPGARLFVKVLRPRAVERLHRRHAMLRGAGLPVPRSLGWTDDGVLVLEALTGTPLRDRLRGDGPVPSGDVLLDLLGRLPEEVLDLPRRRPWAEHVQHYANVVAAAVPEEGGRCDELARGIAAQLDGHEPDEPTHGDFYEGQLLIDGARVSGLLDVDTAGPGRRADDVACMLAHLHVLADMDAARAGRLLAVADEWQSAAERVLDPVELRYRVAGVLMSLATGPHRVQEAGWHASTVHRIDLVERWFAAADLTRHGVPASG